jgi:hypothetical protein
MAPAGDAVPTGARRRFRTRRIRLMVIIAVVLAAWLLIGLLRAESIARDYFAHAHGPGATVINVQIERTRPAIPPFWAVFIGGDVIEAGKTTPAYRSHMILWVESITGWVLVFGAG